MDRVIAVLLCIAGMFMADLRTPDLHVSSYQIRKINIVVVIILKISRKWDGGEYGLHSYG